MPAPTCPKRCWRMLAIAMAAAAALFGAAWGASLRWQFGLTRGEPGVGRVALSFERAEWTIVVAEDATTRGGLWYADRANPWRLRWWPTTERLAPDMWCLRVPFWIPTAACVLAAVTLWRIDSAHRRRLRTGLCPACGYDRAGLAGGVACPECGAVPSPPAAASR